jgi:ATP-dependent Clp protease ATP-binding subunit ClpA
MYVDDLEIPMDTLAETARRVIGRAVEESRRREHSLLYQRTPVLRRRPRKTIEIDRDVLDLVAADGYSVAFGARFLKRVIDERIKLPITMHWNDGSHFRVRVEKQTIVVEADSVRLAAA